MRCTKCNAQLQEDAGFCTVCGNKIEFTNNDTIINTDSQTPVGTMPDFTAMPNPHGVPQNNNPSYNPNYNASYNPNYNPNYNASYNPNYNMGFNQMPNQGMGINYGAATITYASSPMYRTVDGDVIPEKYKPITAWSYFGYTLLFAIPIIGFIFLIIYSLGGTSNINLRNYARSYFCIIAAALILYLLLFVLAVLTGAIYST